MLFLGTRRCHFLNSSMLAGLLPVVPSFQNAGRFLNGLFLHCAHRVTAAFGNLAASKFTRLLDHPDNQVVEDDLKCIEHHVLGHSSRATLLLQCNGANVIANLLLDSRRNNSVKVMAGRCLVCISECEAVRSELASQPIVLQVLLRFICAIFLL